MTRALSLLVVAALMAVSYLVGSFQATRVVAVPPASWSEGSAAAQAWREFAVSLEAAGARVFEASDDPAERLEGLLYLGQLAAASLEMKLLKGSHSQPRFTDWMSDYRKFLGDSPDAIYHSAELSAEHAYEITGNIGDAEYLGFMLYGRRLNGWNRPVANLAMDAMRFDESGNFRLLLSREPPDGGRQNWLPLEDDVHLVMARQYFHGRAGKQAAHLAIENLSPPASREPDDADMAAGLAATTRFFSDTLDGAIALAAMLSAAPNDIDPPRSYSADFGGVFYPTFDNEYFGGWYRLADDEALVVEGAVPEAGYWGLSLQNRWMQSLDYARHPAALNDAQIATDNGRYRVVVAHREPPVGNWLSTGGKPEGLLSIRYQQSTGSDRPTLRVVKFSELSSLE